MYILEDCGCYNSENIKYNKDNEEYCKIAYVLNGGIFDCEVPTLFKRGDYIRFNHYYSPKKSGYFFRGWYLDSKFKNKVEFEDGEKPIRTKEIYNKNITLYADWFPIDFKVVYNSNKPSDEDGPVSGDMDTQYIKYDKATKLNKNAFSLAKWKFMGWNTKADGTGVTYKDMASVKNLASGFWDEVNLYAQWQPITYKVNFDSNIADFGLKATGKMATKTYTYFNSRGINLPKNIFSCPGMTFTGWSLQSGNSKDFADAASVGYQLEDVAADNKNVVTLYAVWERNNYKLEIYDYTGTTRLNSGDSDKMFESGYSLSSAYSRVVTRKSITGVEIVGKGYSFVNFYTEPNGNGKKYTADSVMALENGSTLKLYLKKKPISYKLVCDLDGGKAGKKLPTTYTVETAPFTLIDDAKLPTKQGYIFAGWETTTDRSSLLIDDSSTKFTPGDYTNNHTIKAIWTPINYSVYLNPISNSYKEGTLSNTESCRCDSKTHIYTDSINLYDNSEANLSADGGWKQTNRIEYSITGWSTKSDGKGKVFANGNINVKDLISYANGTDTDGSTKITLYAVWSPKKYTISYDFDDGTLSSAPKTYKYNANKTVKIGTPKKTGYTFEGFLATPADAYDSTNKCIKAGANCNIKLTAIWKPISYKVVLNSNSKTASFEFGKTVYENEAYDTSVKYSDFAVYANPGYAFDGYNTKANGKGVNILSSTEKINFAGLSTKNGATVTVYAQWTPNSYGITYNSVDPVSKASVKMSEWAGGFAVNKNPSTYTYNPKAKLSLKNPTKYGYVFEGWYTDYNPGTGVFSNKVKAINRNTIGGITLYAKWRIK